MDCNPPGSSVCVVSQAQMLEWVAISFSRDGVEQVMEMGSAFPEKILPKCPF